MEQQDTSTGALIVAGGVAVAKNCNVGGTLGVTGASTLSSTLRVDGAVDINAAADISGTLTLSKDSGTGLAVTKNFNCWWYFRSYWSFNNGSYNSIRCCISN